MQPFFALLYKEFRQQAPIWLALAGVGVFMQLLVTYGFSMQTNPPEMRMRVSVMIGLAWVLWTVYVYGSAGSVFVTEHEEKTYGFLRSQPIRRGTLFAAKISWVLLGTISFGMFLAVETFALLWGFFLMSWADFLGGLDMFSNGQVTVGIGLLFCYTVIGVLVWGLFWSVRCRSQLFALLATFASVFATCFTCKNIFQDHELPVAIGVDAVVGVIALWNAWFWFDRWIDRKAWWASAQEPGASAPGGMDLLTNAATPGVNTPGSCAFMQLIFQAFRQSAWLFAFGILAGTTCIVSRYFIPKENDGTWWFLALGVFTISIFCGSIFTADHRNNTVAMLGHRGVKPGLVWWSRVIPFGIVYFTFVIVCWLMFSTTSRNIWNSNYFILLFSIPFCCGTLISLLFRSPILSPCLTAAFWAFAIGWVSFFTDMVGADSIESVASTFYWSTLPILLGFVIASRLRAGDWLRERSLWRSRRPVVALMVGPMLLLLATVPFLRIYSVPVINLGYYADTWNVEQPSIPDEAYRKIYDIGRAINSADDFKKVVESYQTLQQINAQHRWMRYYDRSVSIIISLKWTLERTKKRENFTEPVVKRLDFVTPEFATEAIAFLELLGKNRVPSVEKIRSAYEKDVWTLKSIVKHPPDWLKDSSDKFTLRCLYWMPWERIRSERMLGNDFQILSRFAERTDEAVFENKGDFETLLRNYSDETRKRRLPWTGFYPTLYDELLVGSPQRIYDTELERRALILQFAFLKFGLEKNRLPDSLDDLVKAGILKELPTVPCNGEPFEYRKDDAMFSARVILDLSRTLASVSNLEELRKNMRTHFEIERFPE